MKRFLILIALMIGAGVASADPMRLSVAEAKRFCEEVWFPRLRIGHEPTSQELSTFVTKLLELYTDDIEILDPNSQDLVGSDSLRGKAQVRIYYEAILKNYPKWNIQILDIYPTEKGFVLRYAGRNAGPVNRFEGVDILELTKTSAGWRIRKIMEYYDRLPFTEKKLTKGSNAN